jgi:streptogramin lyase
MMLSKVATYALSAAVVLVGAASFVRSQQPANDPNSAPNPYHLVDGWAKLPPGRSFGQVISVKPDRDGKHIWAFDRCGGRFCTDSTLSPIMEFDASGKLVKNFGAGLFVFPHGLFIDKHDNIWVTDSDKAPGKGDQVIELSRDGKVLRRMGKADVEGEGPDVFNKPTDVLIAPKGDIFVADGHGNHRIVKYDPRGKFLMQWGTKGSGPGQFSTPHSLAMDADGRLFVADRENNRVEIFDQDGKFLADWRQFGRPSGVFIDKHNQLYVTDAQSNDATNPGFKRGIRIGSAKTGVVTAFIPIAYPNVPTPQGTGRENNLGAEGVAADDAGNVYGAETGGFGAAGGLILRKYAKN